MNSSNHDFNVTNNVRISNRDGSMVSFEATSHYDATSHFSDTIDLPTPGRIWVNGTGTITLLPVGSDTPLTYIIDTARELPIVVKRIYVTDTTVTEVFIWN
jgi:hypothetical protein